MMADSSAQYEPENTSFYHWDRLMMMTIAGSAPISAVTSTLRKSRQSLFSSDGNVMQPDKSSRDLDKEILRAIATTLPGFVGAVSSFSHHDWIQKGMAIYVLDYQGLREVGMIRHLVAEMRRGY